MEKTYKFVHHDTPLTRQEISQLYDGWWVYVVNAEFTKTNGFVRGIPVVIGEKRYDGAEDGIYAKYRDEKYEERCDIPLLYDETILALLEMEGKVT